MRSVVLLRSLATLAVASLLLWFLAHRDLIEVRSLLEAAHRAPGTALLMTLLQLVPLGLGALRYHFVLRAMSKHVPFTAIVAANCVSGAASIWLPASAGVMEVLRFGLLVRATGGAAAAVSKTDLAVAGLVDRLLGLATIAIVGLAGSAYILVVSHVPDVGVGVIMALTTLLAAACVLPFVAVSHPYVDRAIGSIVAGRLAMFVSGIVAALRQVDQRSVWFALALCSSVAISIVTTVAFYLALRLFSQDASLLSVAVALSPIALASLLPANVAGFGGNQAAAAVIFSALAIDPRAGALASLLFSTAGLVITSLAGLTAAPLVWRRSRAEGSPAITAKKASAE